MRANVPSCTRTAEEGQLWALQQGENKIVLPKGRGEDPVWAGGKGKAQESTKGKESKVGGGFHGTVVSCYSPSCMAKISLICLFSAFETSGNRKSPDFCED